MSEIKMPELITPTPQTDRHTKGFDRHAPRQIGFSERTPLRNGPTLADWEAAVLTGQVGDKTMTDELIKKLQEEEKPQMLTEKI